MKPNSPTIKSSSQTRHYLYLFGVFFLMPLLGACSWRGDFGEVQKSTIYSTVKDRAGDVWALIHEGVSEFPLTEAEFELRDSVRHFQVAINGRGAIGGEFGGETAYAYRLMRANYPYGPGRLGEILENISADRQAFERFRRATRVVVDNDGERVKSLASPVSSFTPRDKRNARNRIKENRQIVLALFRDLRPRIAAYDYAMERSKIEVPGAPALEAAAALDLLRERAAIFRSELVASGYLKRNVESMIPESTVESREIYSTSWRRSSQTPLQIIPRNGLK